VRVFAPKVSLGFPEALGGEIFDYRRRISSAHLIFMGHVASYSSPAPA
jgi:hypothetical protein